MQSQEMTTSNDAALRLSKARWTGPGKAGSNVEVVSENLTVAELVQMTVDKHQQTTTSAQTALKTLEETLDIQGVTIDNLEKQDLQIRGTKANVAKIEENVGYSEKLLRYMRRGWCCGCFAVDPEEEHRRKLAEQRVRGGKSREDRSSNSGGGSRGAKDPDGGGGGAQLRDPNIKLPAGQETTAAHLATHTRTQNECLDAIGNKTGQLLENARVIRAKVEGQVEALDGLNDRVDPVKDRVHNMKDSSQMRKPSCCICC